MNRVAAVYPDALTRGTLRLLHGRKEIVLPDQIEGLVEAVYPAEIPPKEDPLHDAYIQLKGIECDKGKRGEQRLMPSPDDPDDFFGNFEVTLHDGENPMLHPELRALTRDADESFEVVCLVKRDGAVYLDEQDTKPLDLDAAPSRDMVQRLVLRSISVAKKSAVRFFLGDSSNVPTNVPKAWREHALLRYRRLVLFEECKAALGDLCLRLDPDLGLEIIGPDRKEKKTSC